MFPDKTLYSRIHPQLFYHKLENQIVYTLYSYNLEKTQSRIINQPHNETNKTPNINYIDKMPLDEVAFLSNKQTIY